MTTEEQTKTEQTKTTETHRTETPNHGVEVVVDRPQAGASDDERIIKVVVAQSRDTRAELNRGFDRVVAAIQNAPRPAAAAQTTRTDSHAESAHGDSHAEHTEKEVSTSQSSSSSSSWNWRPSWPIIALLVVILLLVLPRINDDWDPIGWAGDSIASLGSPPSNMCNGHGSRRMITSRGTTVSITGC